MDKCNEFLPQLTTQKTTSQRLAFYVSIFKHSNPFAFYDKIESHLVKSEFQGFFGDLLGFDSIERVASNGIDTLNAINASAGQGIETIKGSNEIFSRFVAAATPALEEMTKTLGNVNTGFSKTTILGLLSLLYSLWRVRKDKIAMLSILCSHGLLHIGTPLFDFFKENLNNLKCKVGKFQNFSKDTGIILNDNYDNIIKYFPLLSTVALIFLAPILKSGPLDPIAYMKSMSTVAIEKAGAIGRATTGIQSFYNIMSSLVQTALNSILYHCCGIKRTSIEEQFNESVKTLLSEVDEISDYNKQHAALLDNRILDKLQKIQSRAYDLCKTYDNLKNTPSWEILRIIMDRTKQLHAKLVDVCSAKDKERTAPVAIMIQGQSGIGKSFLTDYIVKYLAKYHNKLVTDEILEGPRYDLTDLGQLKYPFNAANEYYDGYKQQFAVVMDDFGQRRDTESNPNPELNEIIQIVNEAQYVVHSAHLAEKGKIYMRSNFVLASSNTLKHDVRSITYPLAMYRRFSYIAQFSVKPQYAAPNGSLDLTKVDGIQTDLYNISLIEPASILGRNGIQYLRQNISMREFLYLVCNRYKDQFSKQKLYSDFINNDDNFDVNFAEFQYFEDESIAFDTYYNAEEDIVEELDFDYRDLFIEFKNNIMRDIRIIWSKVTNIQFSWESFKEKFTFFNVKTNFKWCGNAIVENWKCIVTVFVSIVGLIGLFYTRKDTNCRNCAQYDKSHKTLKDAVIYLEYMYKNKTCVQCINCRHIDMSVPTNELIKAVNVARITPVKMEVLRDEQGYTALDKFVKNMFNIYSTKESDRALGRLTMIKGRVALTNYHIAKQLQQRRDFYMSAFNAGLQKIVVSDCKFVYPECEDSSFRDYALIAMPTMDAFANLHKHICTAAEMRHFENTRVNLLKFEGNKQVIRNGEARASDVPINCEGGKCVRQSYAYDIPTQAGDCGSLLVAENKSLAHKIIGIHSLGTINFNASACLTFERVDNLLKQIPANFQIAVPELPSVIENGKLLTHQDEPIFNVRNEGTLINNINSPMKSNIVKSPLYGKIEEYPPTCMPARMYNPSNDPMTLGLKKVANLPEPLDSQMLDKCAQHFFNGEYVINNNTKSRVLTYEEGISGCKELGVVPLNRTTSPGYPYVIDNPGKGKQYWFGKDEYIYSEEIRAKVEHRIEQAKLGNRVETLWIDTLKDERRPIEKVQANKTRVFSVGPQDYIIAVRMYFGAFVGHIMRKRIDNEICVGINCYTDEWTKLAMRLREGGTKIIAGDFSNFDGSLLIDVLRKICECINEWYNDGNDLIRTVLFEEICNGIHVCRGHVYRWTHSQPSGNPLTVIINSIFNSIIMRMAFLKTGRTLISYDKHVRMANFGDDNLFSVSEECIKEFNQLTITDYLASMGLTYTDEGKTGELVEYRNLDNVAFLKRGFRKTEEGRFKAPLALATITEMCQWLRSSADPKGDCKTNVENALFELSLHNTETWNDVSEKILAACRRNGIHIGHYDRLDYYNERIREMIKDNDFEQDEVAIEEIGIFQSFNSKEELHAKTTNKRESIVSRSRHEATHQSKEAYLGRQALGGIPKVSDSTSESVVALVTSKQSTNNNQIYNNGKFSLLTQGTKEQFVYDHCNHKLILTANLNNGTRVLTKTCEENDVERNMKILRIKVARGVRKHAYKPSRMRPASYLESNISGDDKTRKVVKNILESNISGDECTKKLVNKVLECISGDEKTTKHLNKILESNDDVNVQPNLTGAILKMAKYFMKVKLSSVTSGVLWNVYAGMMKEWLPENVYYGGVLLPKEIIFTQMQEMKIEPWCVEFERYVGKNKLSLLNYSFYVLTALIEESIFTWDEKMSFGLTEFFHNIQSRTVQESFPALCCHFCTYILGLLGFGFISRLFTHALYNVIVTYWNRNGKILKQATLINEHTDNAAVNGTETGEVMATSDDAHMTQLVQDQTIVRENVQTNDVFTTDKNNLAQTLQRKVLIRKFDIHPEFGYLQNFIVDEFPQKLFSSSQFLTARLQNYRYIRGSIKFTFMINATKFDVGQIYVSWIPNGAIDTNGTFDDYNHYSMKSVTSAIGIPIKIGPGVVGELTVPCLIPYKGYDMHADMYSYGVLRAFVINPIKAASSDPVHCTYYAEFCPDVQVEVAMPNSGVARHQPVRPATLLESVSSALTVVKNITSVIPDGIPIVSEIAGSIGSVLSLFGWSKSNNVEDVHQFSQLPSKEINHSRGIDGSIVLGLDSKDCSGVTDTYCYRKPYDEMTFEYLYKQRCLNDVLEWQHDGLHNKEDGSVVRRHIIQVKPWDPEISSPDNKDMDFADVDYLGMIGNTFDLWTGGIEYHIEILNHMAQSGRIRVGIFPPISTTEAMTMSDEDFDNVPNQILDIQANQTSLTFEAPFLLPTAWANSDTPGCTIVIVSLNDLVYQTGTPDTAYVNIWRRGTNSLKFSSPRLQTDFVPQWRHEEDIPARFQYFVEDSDAKRFQTFETERCVDDANVDTFKSVKDLTNRSGIVASNITNKLNVWKWNTNLFGSLGDTYSSDDQLSWNSQRPTMLEYYSRLFAFVRGSMNFKAIAFSGAGANNGIVYTSVNNTTTTTPNEEFFVGVSDLLSTDTTPRMIEYTATHPLIINPIIEVNVPQFSQLPMRAVQYKGRQDNRVPLGESMALAYESRNLQIIFNNDSRYDLMMGGGDDLQFTTPYGVPRLARLK